MATCAASSALVATPRVDASLVRAGFQRRSKVCPRRSQRRSDPEQDARWSPTERRECQDPRIDARIHDGGLRAGSHSMKSFPHQARMAPPIPPKRARRRVSVSNCRTTRQRLAPSVRRIATSWRRADARTSSRVARLTHPISRMAATTANTTDRISCASMRGPSGPCAPGRTRSCGMLAPRRDSAYRAGAPPSFHAPSPQMSVAARRAPVLA